jgi:EF-hand domain pair
MCARLISSTILVVLLTQGFEAFTPMQIKRHSRMIVSSSSSPSLDPNDMPFYVNTADVVKPTSIHSKAKNASGGGAIHKNGVLSPIVQISKMALGEEKLNKLRAKVISLHSDVIANFVSTSDSLVGSLVLKQLFSLTDKDRNGAVDETELKSALQTLGFDWLKEKQIKGILERADTDANGSIDVEEWMQEAPKTLRTNLIKLAKKNGGDMGLLV